MAVDTAPPAVCEEVIDAGCCLYSLSRCVVRGGAGEDWGVGGQGPLRPKGLLQRSALITRHVEISLRKRVSRVGDLAESSPGSHDRVASTIWELRGHMGGDDKQATVLSGVQDYCEVFSSVPGGHGLETRNTEGAAPRDSQSSSLPDHSPCE